MIVTHIAYDADKDLGRAYSEAFARVRDDDWVCLLDHDAMFTTYDWYKQLTEAVEHAPGSTGLITGVTNRIGNLDQKALDAPISHDIRIHREFGTRRALEHGAALTDVTGGKPVSGVVMCIPKRAWLSIGEPPRAFLGVDNWIHLALRSAGYRIFLMRGLYLYHWYRGDNADHLVGAPRVDRDVLRRVGLPGVRTKKPKRRVWPRH